MNNEYFRWGIIGTGGIANAFRRDLEYLVGHRVSAVLSRSMLIKLSVYKNMHTK